MVRRATLWGSLYLWQKCNSYSEGAEQYSFCLWRLDLLNLALPEQLGRLMQTQDCRLAVYLQQTTHVAICGKSVQDSHLKTTHLLLLTLCAYWWGGSLRCRRVIFRWSFSIYSNPLFVLTDNPAIDSDQSSWSPDYILCTKDCAMFEDTFKKKMSERDAHEPNKPEFVWWRWCYVRGNACTIVQACSTFDTMSSPHSLCPFW